MGESLSNFHFEMKIEKRSSRKLKIISIFVSILTLSLFTSSAFSTQENVKKLSNFTKKITS